MVLVSPSLKVVPGNQVATFAAGCFWGVEHIFRKHFDGKGLVDARVGYCGGVSANPTYKQVCTSATEHAEALQIEFDPKLVTYETLVDFFFRIHDPTTLNRQGPDVGSQYRSAIFTHSTEQQKTAEEVKIRMQNDFWGKPIATQVLPITNWWDAEDYHQLYLHKNVGGYECPTHYLRKKPEVSL